MRMISYLCSFIYMTKEYKYFSGHQKNKKPIVASSQKECFINQHTHTHTHAQIKLNHGRNSSAF